MSKTVMLIHGAWLTPAAWDQFRRRCALRGHTVLVPPWPFADMPLDRLRQWPPAELGRLTIGRIVGHYESLIRALPEPPILIGHSHGGLVVQLLLDRGLGAAGVALAPSPTPGIRPVLSTLAGLLAWRSWDRARTMPFGRFAGTVAQTLPETEKRPAYDLYVAPAPGRLAWQAALGLGTRIGRGNPQRPPLLLVAGDADRTVPPSAVQAVYRRQRRAPSQTAFRSFPGRSHFLLAEPGWEEVADFALDWALERALGDAQVSRSA